LLRWQNAMTDPLQTIPLFPLGVVLFPDGPLPLRIFETRYVDMVRSCLRNDAPFGVVQIRTPAETGGSAQLYQQGTLARIVDFNPLPDGLLGITCRGSQRFQIIETQRQADGLLLGQVQLLPADPVLALPPDYEHLARLLRGVLPQLGSLYAAADARYDDASWVSCRLAEILPLEPPLKQQLLECTDPLQRLEQLLPWLERDEDESDDEPDDSAT
jgi:Lon protease-like protein